MKYYIEANQSQINDQQTVSYKEDPISSLEHTHWTTAMPRSM